VSMCALIKDQTQSWFDTYKIRDSHGQGQFDQYQASFNANNSNYSPAASVKKSTVRPFASNVCNSTANLLDTDNRNTAERLHFCIRDPLVPFPNPHWRKLRLIVLTIGAFKYRQYSKKSGSLHGGDPRRKYNTRFLRMELVNYLQETLPYLQSRNLETGFGFTRRVGNRCAKFVKLIQDILLIITKFEGHIESMEKCPEFHYLYEAFFLRPNLHYGFAVYVQSIVDVIMSISVVLVEQSVFDDQLLTPGNEGFKAVAAAAKLIRARKYFDAEYLKARRDLFYPRAETEAELDGQAQERDTADSNVTAVPPPPTPPPLSAPGSLSSAKGIDPSTLAAEERCFAKLSNRKKTKC